MPPKAGKLGAFAQAQDHTARFLGDGGGIVYPAIRGLSGVRPVGMECARGFPGERRTAIGDSLGLSLRRGPAVSTVVPVLNAAVELQHSAQWIPTVSLDFCGGFGCL